MLILIADGPHEGARDEIAPTAGMDGLERTVRPAADGWLAAAVGSETIDRDSYWYIARYDADPDFAPQTAKGGVKRAYCFRDLRVIAKQSTAEPDIAAIGPAVEPTPEPAPEPVAAEALGPLTLF